MSIDTKSPKASDTATSLFHLATQTGMMENNIHKPVPACNEFVERIGKTSPSLRWGK